VAHFNFGPCHCGWREFDGSAQQALRSTRAIGKGLVGKLSRLATRDRVRRHAARFSPPVHVIRSESRCQQQIGIAQHSGNGIVQFVGAPATSCPIEASFSTPRSVPAIVSGWRKESREWVRSRINSRRQALTDENHDSHEQAAPELRPGKRTDTRGNWDITRATRQRGERKSGDHSQAGQPHA